MAADLNNRAVFFQTDASNNTATDPGWPELMLPGRVNDSARALQGAITRDWDRRGPTVTSGGSANAQTLTYTVAQTAIVRGDCYAFIAGFTNTAAMTLAVSGLTAKAVQQNAAALTGGEIVAGRTYAVMYDGTAYQLVSPPSNNSTNPGFRNRLIEGDFSVWLSGSQASTAVADDVYTSCDLWYALTQTAAVNVSQLTDQENGAQFALRMTQNQASAQRMGLAQIVESLNCKDLRGQATVLSPRIRCSSSQAVRYAILEWTGTANSVTSDVVNDWTSGTYTAGNFFLAANLTITAVGAVTPSANTWTTLADLVGTLGSSVNNVVIFIWTEGAAAQNVTLDFDQAQWEQGSSSSRFERIPYDIQKQRIYRYFESSFDDGLAPAQNSGVSTGELRFNAGKVGALTETSSVVTYKVTKRGTTSVTLFNPSAANAQVRDTVAAADCSSSSASGNRVGFFVTCIGNASTAVGNSLATHWTADARL